MNVWHPYANAELNRWKFARALHARSLQRSMVGAPPQNPPSSESSFTLSELGTALKKVTPTLLILGIATGAAFAIGSGLVSLFLFKGRR